MAVWYDKLYVGTKAQLMYPTIYKSIENETYLKDVYLITLAVSDKDQLDIYDSIRLYFPALKRRLQPIIGIALGKEEATSLFVDIAKDVYKETGELKLKEYFQKRFKDQETEEKATE